MKIELNAAVRLQAADAGLVSEFKKVVAALQKTEALRGADPSVKKPTVVRWFYKGDEDVYQVNIEHGELTFLAQYSYQEGEASVDFVATGKTADELYRNIKREVSAFVPKHGEDSEEPVSDDSLEELQSIASELK